MAKKRRTAARSVPLKPEDILTFVELRGFQDDLRRLELTDADLHELQVRIMVQPDAAPVVQGTGGLRKLRFAPSRWNIGKSGAARVCYVYFEQWDLVLLVTLYSKDEQDDIPAAHRAAYRRLIEQIRNEFAARPPF
jgi:hypothetical protein